jgi:N-methylhydantoinase B
VLEDCRVSIISERRQDAPQGERGGTEAATGRNLINGDEVPAKHTRDLHAGDTVTIETPGGGGWGD